MKKLIMLIMVLVIISHSLIGQQVDRNSVTYSGGFSIKERIESFYQKIQMKHNGTDFTWRSKKEQSRRSKKEQKKLYVQGERLKRK